MLSLSPILLLHGCVVCLTFFSIPNNTYCLRRTRSATFLAAMDPDGMHLGNAKTAPIFIKNFFTDFRASLDKDKKKIIKEKTGGATSRAYDFFEVKAKSHEMSVVGGKVLDTLRRLAGKGHNLDRFCTGTRKSADAIIYLGQKQHSSYDATHANTLNASMESLRRNYGAVRDADVIVTTLAPASDRNDGAAR